MVQLAHINRTASEPTHRASALRSWLSVKLINEVLKSHRICRQTAPYHWGSVNDGDLGPKWHMYNASEVQGDWYLLQSLRYPCSWLPMDSSVNTLKHTAATYLAGSLHAKVFQSHDQHKGDIAVTLSRCSIDFATLETNPVSEVHHLPSSLEPCFENDPQNTCCPPSHTKGCRAMATIAYQH